MKRPRVGMRSRAAGRAGLLWNFDADRDTRAVPASDTGSRVLRHEHLPARRPGPTPPATSAATAKVMRRAGRRDTQPELRLRRALHRRVEVPPRHLTTGHEQAPTRRHPLRGARIAVFVDGCFWHSWPVHAQLPKSNRDWWRRKLEDVVLRDRDTDAELTAAGWLVVRVWEHEGPDTAADRIAHLITGRVETTSWPTVQPGIAGKGVGGA